MTPFGEVVAVPERGTFFGNRGVLHDGAGRIRRPWQVKRWILCLLEFHGRHREVMALDRYTGLFFLDEATGLAAGHRPCAECRHTRFVAFRDAWTLGNGSHSQGDSVRAATIDDRLHEERVGPGPTKRMFRADLDDLPDGVFVSPDDRGGEAYLIRGNDLLLWSPGGYTGRRPRPRGDEMSVLTPGSTVAAIRAGYRPEVHPSAVGA